MLVANLTLVLVALAVMFVLSPLLSLVIVVFVPLFAYLSIRFRDRCSRPAGTTSGCREPSRAWSTRP
jgi:ABC-type multidrug transport system fused ATPase/permease subunit